MYGGYLVFVVLIVRLDGSIANDVECNYVYNHSCYVKQMDDLNRNATVMHFCTKEEIPEDVNFVLMLDGNKTSKLPAVLKIDFTPSKVTCKYGVSLLTNASINNENDCMNHNFQDSVNIEGQTHNAEKTICSVSGDDHPSIRSNNGTITQCQDNIVLWYEYIFTGCYAIRFHVDEDKFLVRGNRFLKVDYENTQITPPTFHCTYDVISTVDQSKRTSLVAMDVSMIAETEVLLRLGLWSDLNERETCIWSRTQQTVIGTVAQFWCKQQMEDL